MSVVEVGVRKLRRTARRLIEILKIELFLISALDDVFYFFFKEK